jgi:ferredoxin/DMSO/TMAO reductase YedYZ heme-binding membrane subunit
LRSGAESVHMVATASGAQSVHLVAAVVGFLSFFLIWLSVVWGLILRNGWISTRLRHSTIHGTHMIVSLLGLTLAFVHAAAQLAVPFASVHLIDEVVPFTNPTDPLGIGLAVISLEVMTAAALSSMIQRKMGYNRWRALHALNHVAFVALVAHILISGSDVSPRPVWGSVLLAWVVTVVLYVSTARRTIQTRRAVGDKLGVVQRRDEVIVGVDSSKCARFGFCEHEAPNVFTLLSDGRLSYRVSVPVEEVNDVVRAIDVCPRRAISLNRTPTAMVSGVRPVQPVQAAEDPHLTSPRGLRQVKVTDLHKRRVQ